MTRLFAFNFIVSLLLVPIASVSAGGPASPEILDSPESIVAAGASPSKLRFERKQFTLSRQRGDIRFDGTLVDPQAVANGDQRIRLIETFDHARFKNDPPLNINGEPWLPTLVRSQVVILGVFRRTQLHES